MSKIHQKLIIVLLFTSCILSSCKKEKQPQIPVSSNSGDAIIICEGLFGAANSRIDVYDRSTNSIIENVFTTANNRPLGDIAQSGMIINNKLYLVVNNSSKIEVLNLDNFKSEQIVHNLQSPRIILNLHTKLYVSDIYANKIHVLSYPDLSYIKAINRNGWTEELLYLNNLVYTSNFDHSFVYLIEPNTDQIIDSISISAPSGSILRDKNDKIWVLTGGGIGQNSNNQIHRINPQSKSIEKTINLNTSGAFKLKINRSGDKLYYLKGSQVFTLSIDQETPELFYQKNSATWYGIAFDPTNTNIWLCDAKSYVENGEITIISPEGIVSQQFNTGIIPNDVIFIP